MSACNHPMGSGDEWDGFNGTEIWKVKGWGVGIITLLLTALLPQALESIDEQNAHNFHRNFFFHLKETKRVEFPMLLTHDIDGAR
jgi:hypothetical protein